MIIKNALLKAVLLTITVSLIPSSIAAPITTTALGHNSPTKYIDAPYLPYANPKAPSGAEQRKAATDDGYSEPHLWTGVGRARSGCGAALVGSVDQVMSKIERYQKMGIRSFIFSGYPHQAECEIFGNKVLPQLKTCSLPEVYGRIPASTPPTPLGIGERK